MAEIASGRWSRTRAGERWSELGSFAGRPLGIGLAVVGLWPSFALMSTWDRYAQPLVALAVYLLSLAMVLGLWWQGRRGIGPAVSVSAGIGLATLNIVLVLQLPPGEPFGAAAWLAGWGAAVPMVLGFSRPIEEPLAILAVLAATNVVTVARADQTIAALHNAPLHVAMPIAVTASGLVLVQALRQSVRNARTSRDLADALTQRERVSEATERERTRRFAAWQDRITPLLEDVADGRRSARDPDLGAVCMALASDLRTELSAASESILHALLPDLPGVDVVIRDNDVGYRLVATDRIALVGLVRDVCAGKARGRLQITLMPDAGPGAAVTHAVVVLAAENLPVPGARDGGTLIESPPCWWYDLTLRCEPAPAIPAHVGMARAPKP